jgi:hypothetical protein
LEANRRNAQKSTGPGTAQGKSQSRMNGLRNGERSRLYRDLLPAMLDAPPGGVVQTARAVLTPAQAADSLFAQLAEVFSEPERLATRHYWKLFPAQGS